MEVKVIPAKTETQVVVVKEPQITLTLTEKEASMLLAVMGNIGGSDGSDGVRAISNEIYSSLYNYFKENGQEFVEPREAYGLVKSKFSRNITTAMQVGTP